MFPVILIFSVVLINALNLNAPRTVIDVGSSGADVATSVGIDNSGFAFSLTKGNVYAATVMMGTTINANGAAIFTLPASAQGTGVLVSFDKGNSRNTFSVG